MLIGGKAVEVSKNTIEKMSNPPVKTYFSDWPDTDRASESKMEIKRAIGRDSSIGFLLFAARYAVNY